MQFETEKEWRHEDSRVVRDYNENDIESNTSLIISLCSSIVSLITREDKAVVDYTRSHL